MWGNKTKKPAQPSGNGASNDELKTLIESLPQALAQANQQMMQQLIKGIQPQQQPAPQQKKETRQEPKTPTADEINEMDNAGLFNLLVSTVTNQLTDFGEHMNEQVSGLSQKLTTTQMQSRVKEVSSNSTDFDAYKPMMAQLAKQYPNLDPGDLYELAKAKDTETTARLKQEADTRAAAERAAAEKTKPRFGGLTPTSGIFGDEDGEDMDFNTAAEKAWESAMADLPPEIIGGSNH